MHPSLSSSSSCCHNIYSECERRLLCKMMSSCQYLKKRITKKSTYFSKSHCDVFVTVIGFLLLFLLPFVNCKLLRHQPIIPCTNNIDCYIPCITKPCPPIYHCMHGFCKNIKFYEICGTKRICNKGINEFCCNTFIEVNTTFNYCSDGICGSKRPKTNTIACPKISCSQSVPQ
jgi:hypothetical protein